MRQQSPGVEKIRQAIELMRADLNDLERHLPAWDSGSTAGAKIYRPIAKRIVSSAQRLKELVFENTYSYP